MKSKKGFTLIEVILVLAVGSLIFAMAFIAYGQASRNRRDSQRRADLGKIAQELENYAADNNGKYPHKKWFGGPTESTFYGFVNDYIPATLEDPSSGNPYLTTSDGVTLDNPDSNGIDGATPGKIEYAPEEGPTEFTFCDGVTVIDNNSKRDYVVRMKLETGVACRDSRQ